MRTLKKGLSIPLKGLFFLNKPKNPAGKHGMILSETGYDVAVIRKA